MDSRLGIIFGIVDVFESEISYLEINVTFALFFACVQSLVCSDNFFFWVVCDFLEPHQFQRAHGCCPCLS